MAGDIVASDGDAIAPLAETIADLDLSLNTCEFLDHIPDITEVDPRGDKILLVGTNTCQVTDDVHHHEAAMRFRVCSRTLGRFSPVMAAMLDKVDEATQEKITFPEDNPKAMTTLLDIAHGHIGPVYDIGTPANYSFLDDVYQIAVLANKYKVTPMLRPWAPTWISMLERRVVRWENVFFPTMLENGETDYMTSLPTVTERVEWEKALYIANEAGHVKIYKDMFVYLHWFTRGGGELFSCTLDPSSVKGQCFGLHFMVCRNKLTSFPDQIIISRWQCIENITAVLRDAIDTLVHCGLDDATAGRYTCNAARPGTRGDCKIHTLGVIIRHLSRNSLWPLPRTEEFPESPFSLRRLVTDGMWSERGLHKDCSIRATLDEALKEAQKVPRQDILPQSAIEEMLARAASLGCSNKTSRS
ncbi:hypothetical protein KJ359_005525 [Pestalotiopsis sp. 9143b]|nr:hypothetical protein KJ359_005525 [Pestalotiopsis sp. 9143b]